MLAGPDDMPSKAAKELPEDAKKLFARTYNEDFAWRAQEAHALKAAWRAVQSTWKQDDEGQWVRK